MCYIPSSFTFSVSNFHFFHIQILVDIFFLIIFWTFENISFALKVCRIHYLYKYI